MGVSPPPRSGGSDHLTLLSGASQNVLGIAIAAVATFGAQILMTRTLGEAPYGIITVTTQAAFVLSFLTRAGTDMAVLRDVAVEVGAGRTGGIRALVSRSAAIALTASVIAMVLGLLGADQIRSLFSIDPEKGRYTVELAALGLPFLALANLWLSATRGLKIMRYTLYVFWAGQPTLWVVFTLIGWRFYETAWMAVLAYSASWAWASVMAWLFWRKESKGWAQEPLGPGAMNALMRYAGPRAPAALFSQLLFWTDLFVLTRYASDAEVGIYSAALRAGQLMVLFLTSVSLMFSPFVADLHARGERDRLDKLFKSLTRWTLAATLPAFLLLAIAPGSVLRVFGSDFAGGEDALLILLAGQLVNVATGSVGFVLIMVGRTGWDLVVYGASLVLNLGLAFALCPRYGMAGAAVANSVTFALSKWARLALVKRFIDIQPYDRTYLRLLPPVLVGAAVMGAVHAALSVGWALDVLATGLLGSVAFAAVYLTLGLTPEERRGLSGLIAKFRAR